MKKLLALKNQGIVIINKDDRFFEFNCRSNGRRELFVPYFHHWTYSNHSNYKVCKELM
jgi:hypothetical protein